MLNDIAYIAGLFDGEGSVRLRFRDRHKKSKSRGRSYNHHVKEYELQISITNKNIDCLTFCQKRYGGRIYKMLRKVPAYTWSIQGKKALVFIEDVRPFVIVKKPHIEAILTNRENKAYASQLVRIFNTRGVKEYPLVPLM